jgi:hypothetical protein
MIFLSLNNPPPRKTYTRHVQQQQDNLEYSEWSDIKLFFLNKGGGSKNLCTIRDQVAKLLIARKFITSVCKVWAFIYINPTP